MRFVFVCFFAVAFVFLLRLGYVQIVRHGYYLSLAAGQRNDRIVLEPERGEIFVWDRNGSSRTLRTVAANRKLNLVYAVPKEIPEEERGRVVDSLSSILELDREKVLARVEKEDDPYEPIQHFVKDSVVESIAAENLPGVYFVREYDRYYPFGKPFAHVTGFYGFSGSERKGQYGIEGRWEEVLRGVGGSRSIEKDALGRIIALGDTSFDPPEDGADIVLTLDYTLQSEICTIVERAVERYEASFASVVVMDPSDGRIFVLCNAPSFDPNAYSEVENIRLFTNHAVTTAYEPGSIFKPITMAAGLDTGSVSPSDSFIDEGEVTIGSDTIRNADEKVYGEQTMVQVLEKSINTGIVNVALKTGKKQFVSYVKQFGFGSKTGIGLGGEHPGDISNLGRKGDIYLATASFGQGITVTVLQMARAFSAIANGGKLITPFIIDEIRFADGRVKKQDREDVQQVISRKTATTLSAMLVSVVKNGQGKNADVPGYYLAGKTGTAQIAKENGRGYSKETNHSFVGFGPVENPRFVVALRIARPKRGRFSSTTAAPTFQEIARFLLQYFEIEPQEGI